MSNTFVSMILAKELTFNELLLDLSKNIMSGKSAPLGTFLGLKALTLPFILSVALMYFITDAPLNGSTNVNFCLLATNIFFWRTISSISTDSSPELNNILTFVLLPSSFLIILL